jgi:hypothetical protein
MMVFRSAGCTEDDSVGSDGTAVLGAAAWADSGKVWPDVTLSLSVLGLRNAGWGDSEEGFTFLVGDQCYRCPCCVARFVSPRVWQGQMTDATMHEMRVEVEFEDAGELFSVLLDAARGFSIRVDGGKVPRFLSICRWLRNSELCGTFLRQVGIGKFVDRLGMLSESGCDISADLEFISSHLYEDLRALRSLSYPLIYEILSHRSVQVESEDSVLEFVSECTCDQREFLSLFEFVKLEYCSVKSIKHFYGTFLEGLDNMNLSLWYCLRARLALPISGTTEREFLPSMKKGWIRSCCETTDVEADVPDGIIGYLTREWGGNVHDRKIVDITSSTPWSNEDRCAAKNAADLSSGSYFQSWEGCGGPRENWICYDFKDRRIVPTHYAIRSYDNQGLGRSHLKSWLVETSLDGDDWQEVDRHEDNNELNDSWSTRTFRVASCGACRCIRLVSIGKNHRGRNRLVITGWEIFGSLIE